MSDLNLQNKPDRSFLNIFAGSSNSHFEAKKILYNEIRCSQDKQMSSHSNVMIHKIHKDSIDIIAVSPCGTFAVFGVSDGEMVIFNISSNHSEQIIKGETDNLNSIHFSPNGQYMICGYKTILEIWDFYKRSLDFKISISSGRGAPAIFTADGKFFIIPEKDSLVFWNFYTQTEEFRLNGHKQYISSVACSINGKYFISGSEDGLIIVWDVNLRTQEFELLAHKGKIRSLVISNNGKYAASISESFLKVWSLDKRCEVLTFEHFHHILLLSFSSKSNILAIASHDSFVRVFNIKNKKIEHFFYQEKLSHHSIIFIPNQMKIISGFSEGMICIWNIDKKPKQLTCYQPPSVLDKLDHVSISHNNKYLSLSRYIDGIEFYNLKENKLEYKIENGLNEIYSKFSEDGRYLFTVNTENYNIWDLNTNAKCFEVAYDDNIEYGRFPISKDFSLVVVPDSLACLSVWHTLRNLKLFEVKRNKYKHSTAAFSIDCKFVAFGFSDGYIGIYKVEDMQESYNFQVHNKKVLDIFFTEDNKSIISVSADESIKIWDLINKDLIFTFITNCRFFIYTGLVKHYLVTVHRKIIFWNLKEKCQEFEIDKELNRFSDISYDGKFLVQPYSFHVNIWKLHEFLEFNTLDQYKHYVPIKFSSNKKYAVSGHEKVIKLWTVDEKKELLSFKAHKHWIRSVSFSYDNQFIVSGADDCSVRIWDLNGRELKYFDGHSSWVLSCAFSRDGKYVVSSSNDKVVLLWKVETNSLIKSFRDIKDKIHTICFSNSGKYIVAELNLGLITISMA